MTQIGNKYFNNIAAAGETPIYQRTGGGGTGGGNLLIGHFNCYQVSPTSADSGTTLPNWINNAVGIEVDPNKNYKLLNLMNFGMQGTTLPGANYQILHDPLEFVQIGATIPTVDDGFLLSHFTPIARFNETSPIYAFIKNNTTGKVYREDTILAGTTQNPAQRTVYNVSNTSILWFGMQPPYGAHPEFDIIAQFEVS